MSSVYVLAEQETPAQATIVDPDRDTSGKTVRLYIGDRPFDASAERGSAAGTTQGTDLQIAYEVPDPGGPYEAELVIDDGSDLTAWTRFRVRVVDWQSIPQPQ
jgi:hypothetical protein